MNLYTKNRIYLIFTGIGAFFLLFALLLLNQALTMKQFSDELEKNWMPSLAAISIIDTAVADFRAAEALHIMSTDPLEMDGYEQAMQQLAEDIIAAQSKYEALISSDRERTLYQKFAKSYESYQMASKQTIALSQNNDNVKAAIQLKRSGNLFNNLSSDLHKLVELNNESSDESTNQSNTIFSRTRTMLVIGSILIFLIMAGLSLALAGADINGSDKQSIAVIKRKISLTFLVILVFFLGFSGTFYYKAQQATAEITEFNTNWFPSIIALDEINTQTSKYRIDEALHILSTNVDEMAKLDAELATLSNTITGVRKKYESLISSDEERALYQSFSAEYEEYKTASNRALAASRQNDNQNAGIQLKQSGVLFYNYSSTLMDIIKLNQNGALDSDNKIDSALQSLKIGTAGGVIVNLLLLIIAAQLVRSWVLDAPLDSAALGKSSTLFSIKMKLRLVFFGMVATVILFSLLINSLMNNINDQAVEMEKNWVPSIILINAVNTMASDYRIAEVQHVMATNNIEMLEWNKALKRLTDKIAETRLQYEPLISSEEERNIYQNFSHKYDDYKRQSEKMIALSLKNDKAAANKELQSERGIYDSFTNDLFKLVDINSTGGTQAAQLSKRIFKQAQQIILVVVLSIFMAAILFMIVFDKNISVALQRLTLVVRHLAEGIMVDCKDSFENRHDEIGQMANAVSVVTQTLQGLTHDSVELIEAAQAGVLSARADASRHQGEFGKIVSGMNSLLDVLSKPLLEVAQIMQNLALGELSGRMQGDYEGELRILKANVNQSLDGLVNLLTELSQTMQYMAKADLTHSLVSNYQGEFSVLKANTNQTIVQMIEILKEITSSTSQAAAAITQTSEASKYVAKEASLQMLSVENVSKTIAETAVSVNEISEKSTQSSQLACSTASFVNEGQTLLNKLIDLIQHIDAEYGRIEKITDEITRIADKTHLLSLNAGLEAMRAGDHGLGFGFVAQQIGLLAEEVSVSASNIGEVISSSGQKIRLGVHATQETQAAMEQIADAAHSSERNIQGISAAIAQQSAAVKLLTERINEIRLSSEATASAAEEISTTMVHLALTVRGTAEQAKRFKLTEY